MTMMIETGAETAAAFNRGADARLAGQPRWSNPYPTHQAGLRRWWRYGYDDVSDSWGEHNREMGRAVPPLPPVTGGVA